MNWQDAKAVFRRHPALATSLALATALTLFFAVRFAAGFVYWSAHHKEPVRAWMTAGYIGRSWGLNPREFDRLAGFPTPEAGHPFTLKEIAVRRGVTVDEIIRIAEDTIAKMKAGKP